MKKTIEHFITQCYSTLLKTVLDRREIFETIQTVFLYKYILACSRKLSQPKGNAAVKAMQQTENLTHLVNDTISNFLKTNGRFFDKELRQPLHTGLRNEVLKGLVDNWDSFCYNADWNWSYENILDFFDVLEQISFAGRPEALELITPKEIVSLLPSLIEIKDHETVFDPFCRTGGFLLAAKKQTSSISAKGITNNYSTYNIAAIKAIMLGNRSYEVAWKSIYAADNKNKFDVILTNPPFGTWGFDTREVEGKWQRRFRSNRMELNYACYVLDHLNANGRAAVMLPHGITFQDKMKAFRKALIEDNVLEAIISLPEQLFYKKPIQTDIFVFDYNKADNNVLLVNAESLGKQQKSRRQLQDDDIQLITKIVRNYKTGGRISDGRLSIEVSAAELEQRDFNLEFKIYAHHTVTIRRTPSSKIWKEIVSLNRELAECQSTIAQLHNNSSNNQ